MQMWRQRAAGARKNKTKRILVIIICKYCDCYSHINHAAEPITDESIKSFHIKNRQKAATMHHHSCLRGQLTNSEPTFSHLFFLMAQSYYQTCHNKQSINMFNVFQMGTDVEIR